jgi:hypothetical protein
MDTIREPKANLKLHLHRRAFQHLNHVKPGMTIRVESGLVWMTKSKDLQDYMLRPGSTIEMSRDANVLIEALSDADVTILSNN